MFIIIGLIALNSQFGLLMDFHNSNFQKMCFKHRLQFVQQNVYTETK